MVSLIVLLKIKGYSLKILLKRTRGLLNKENSFLEVQLWEFSEWFCLQSCKWGASCKPTCSLFSPAVLSFRFCFSLSVGLFFIMSLCCGLLLASSMAECFCICSRNSVCRLVLFTGLYPLLGADEVSGEVVVDKSLSYILLLMVPEQVWDWHYCSYCCFCFFVFGLFCLSWFGTFCGFLKKC